MTERGDTEPARPAQGRWRGRDHTRAGLLGSLAVLSTPMLASSGLTLAFQLADLSFLAQLGDAPMAAVIIANQTLRQFVMMLLMGVAFGSQALIARAVGEGDTERAEHVAGQLVLIGAVFSSLVACIGLTIPDLLFRVAGSDPSFAPHGVPYVRLIFSLTFGMAGFQLFNAILSGAGDTTTPFYVMMVQTLVAISAEWILIFGNLGAPQLGVRGVALGTATGQVLAMAIGFSVLFRGRARIHLRRRHLKPDLVTIRQILKLSWPPSVQMGVQALVVVIYVRLAGGFGESVQAAYAIGLRIGMIGPMLCFPLASACATLVAQALGAGNVPRAWRALRIGLLVHCGIMWLIAWGLFSFRGELMNLLSNDPAVIEVGTEYLLYLAGAFVCWAFYFVFFRALQGAGDMLVPMLISVGVSLVISVPLAHLLSDAMGRQGLWLAFLIAVLATAAGTTWRVASGRWIRRLEPGAAGPWA
ncbi:MAG: MATE family efflux transporter [Deltaproteobacteria bacterium]|nr:MATE family efflux transporter [Deltaproteobacteria bacterium]MBW2362340.1 MATE family efflux transporter [Deltaproteobacteria bacterium]